MEDEPIIIRLSWPKSELSPNKRLHWSATAIAKKEYREECKRRAEILKDARGLVVPDGNLVLDMHFIPPDNRRYDRDNLVARMKSGIDGVCEALGFDDVRFTKVIVTTDKVRRTGHVVMSIYADAGGSVSEELLFIMEDG